jgi:serine/threonine-protein kinase
MGTTPRPLSSTELGQLIGSYRVRGLLGEGGMGTVYLAEHIRLGHQVALKRLRDELVQQPDAIRQFMDEARAVNTIRHENIIDVMDVVVSATRAFYVMELLEGRTLAALLSEGGALELQRALHIGFQVADALAAAHAAGFVHQDIKPSNLFLVDRVGRPDFVKLLDFGMVRLVATLPGARAGALAPIRALGTPAYLSPEQAYGAEVGPASDQYSLGVVLYEMLSGRPPFRADTLAGYLFMHMKVEPNPLEAVVGLSRPIPHAVSLAVMRCLRKDPARRFAGIDELRTVLYGAARQTGMSLRSGQPPERRPAPPRQRFGKALGGVMVALVTLALGGGALWAFGVGRGHRAVAVRRVLTAAYAAVVAPSGTAGISLSIDSVPAGARVLRVGPPDVLLGITPLRLRLPGSRTPRQLALRKAGFEDRNLSLAPEQDHAVAVTMVPTPGTARPGAAVGTSLSLDGGVPRPPRSHGLPRVVTRRKLGTTLDPFE